jgi:type IV fimbrial biogenesis protein FimT
MHRERGVTLLELLVAVAVAAILATVAIPDLTSMIRHNRAITSVNSLLHALILARYSAIERNRYVTVCRSSDGRHCTDDANWEDGWLIFVNLDRDYPAQVDSGEPVLYVHGSLAGSAHIISNRTAFTFRPRGIRSTNGTLLYCSSDASNDRALIINVVGRIRLEATDALSNGMDCSDQ